MTQPAAPESLYMADAEDDAASVAEAETRTGPVGSELHGQRLDKALQALAPEFSRSYLQQLLKDGMVQLDGRVVAKPAHKVQAGQRLALELRPTAQSQAYQAQAMPLDVVFEDDELLVLNKPAGLVVHPAAGNWSGTLLNGLLAYNPVFAALPRAGIVHRLDKDTSGLMMVAKTPQAVAALGQQIAQRSVSRRYVALGHARSPGAAWWARTPEVTVNRPIGRDPAQRTRMAVVDLAQHSGKEARTDIRLLAQHGQFGWVECRLHTGRTHQIRVHMQHLQTPLVGDALYGGLPWDGFARQALHAWRLALTHPVTGKQLAWSAPLPADMQRLLADAGLSEASLSADG